ncbi:GAF and ANTAR domain-containing protein [Nonomuraea sp. NPDC002799]
MNTQRSAAVWESIITSARGHGAPVTLETVCVVCARTLDAHGVAIALAGPPMDYEPLCGSSPAAYELMVAHATLGEGPAVAALADQRPILAPDLAEPEIQRRWPMFAPAALRAGAPALFAFPLLLGAISVGVLEISRARAGWMTAGDLADALIFADAALLVHIQQTGLGTGPAGASADGAEIDGAGVDMGGFWHGSVERWAQVHQATGMIAVQAGVDLRTAFVRLRAHAFAAERTLLDVADDVVGRRLRFVPERR